MEVKMSWVEVNGAGWRWVHGLLIPDIKPIYLNKRYLFQKKVYYLNLFLLRKNKAFQSYSV